ncbi:endolytic transglycosylase MltG [Microbacterium sp. T2.11-28]|uniref:endolytic transglycosylase MltG n=1 Tax=Microbacterium sp. T2.11-28 TaxID=3041169 RepID=UPI0024778C7C|nr:endolytic transglycosylase MltG [Microbacterium sp. T2.11-28]CAI9385947.1 Endolytic murein transglycosylase [Microbacterium sp. T2.11-28]
MPENPSSDDQFADLFGKLPSPPQRRTSSSDAAPEDPAPLSRRAAREAAAASSGPAAAPAGDARDASGTPAPRSAAADRGIPETDTAPADDAALVPAGAAPGARRGSSVATEPAPGPRRTPATIDALFGEEAVVVDPHAPDTQHARDRRKSRIAGWVVLGVVLAIIGGIVAGGSYVWVTYEDKIRAFMGWEEPKDYEAGLANGEAVVTIVDGDTGSSISTTLFEAGVTKTPEAFYDYLIANAVTTTFHPGAYQLQLQMTSEAALEALEDPASKLENTAQLREGLTVAQSLPLLSDGTGIPLEDFEAAVADPSDYGVDADSLEGWLFPATYTFNPDVTAADVIRTLVDRTVTSLDAAGVPEDRRGEILTIASIIEREARFEDDFYKVSRVIQNRLDPSNDETFGKLQMDSTAQYGYGEMHDGTVSSSAEALEDDNPWNTYVHEGLPIGPIANPGDTAIKAAMEPADGPWLYFVTVNLDTGETVFTHTYSEHLQAVEQWQAWCADNPDSGC